MLSNPSQTLLRNAHLVKGQNVLMLNIESDHAAQALLEHANAVTALALDFNHYQTVYRSKVANLDVFLVINCRTNKSLIVLLFTIQKPNPYSPIYCNLQPIT